MSPQHWSALKYALPYFLIGLALGAIIERIITWCLP